MIVRPPPTPSSVLHEARRLERLAGLALLEAPADVRFTKVCEIASALFSVPFAFVSLIDGFEAHVFAHCGLGPGRMPRREAMCDATIESDQPLVIAELRDDARFQGSPLVAGSPHMRFYAGVPLEVAPGIRLGAFCIADVAPREMTREGIESLRSLTSFVVAQIEQHERQLRISRLVADLAGRQAILTQTEQLAKVGGFEIDRRTGVMMWSDGLPRLLQVEADVQTLDCFLACFDRESRRHLSNAFRRLGPGAEVDIEACFEPLEARRHFHIHAELHETESGEVKVVGIVQDVSERKKASAELEYLAAHDGLTGLYNRRAFGRYVEEAVGRAEQFGERVALVMIDIDRFKLINDTMGHDVGDVVLLAVTERLRHAVGARGVIGRIGGDEFGVLLAGYEAEGAVAALATQMLLELRKPLHHRGAELGTRATLGVAIGIPGHESVSSLFKEADIALYNAKDAGRDGFAFYRPVMREEIETRFTRLATAREALLSDRIEPYYQPKICLETGKIAGFEALLRWQHPAKGICLPGEIDDAFGDPKLAPEIGRAMLDRVCVDLAGWRAAAVAVRQVAINVAEAELYAGDYAKRLIACLRDHDLPAEALEIEVTESVILGRLSGIVARTLGHLADAGHSITLDDFGTGYASLTHLKRYPVSAIKIDRSFVMNIETDRNDAMIVDAVTSLANSLEIAVVAEGVETPFQADFLRKRRCAMGQGYLFAKPMAASRVPHFIRTWTSQPIKQALTLAG